MKKEILRGTLLLLAFNVLFADEVKETGDFNKYYEVEKAKCINALDALSVTGEKRVELLDLIEDALENEKRNSGYRRENGNTVIHNIDSTIPCALFHDRSKYEDYYVEKNGWSRVRVKGSDIKIYSSDIFTRPLMQDLELTDYPPALVFAIWDMYDTSKLFVNMDTYFSNSYSGIIIADHSFKDKINKSIQNFYKHYKITNKVAYYTTSNPYQFDGALYMGNDSMFQILKPKEALYGSGARLKYVKTIDMAPNSLKGKVLIKNGAFTYQTSGGRQNTVPSFKEIKVDFSKNAKWFVK